MKKIPGVLFLLLSTAVFCPAEYISKKHIIAPKAELSGGYDSNASIKKYNHIIAPAAGDYITRLSLGLDWDTILSSNNSVSYYYYLGVSDFRNIKSQDASEHFLGIKYREIAHERTILESAFDLEYHTENDTDWTYVQGIFSGLIHLNGLTDSNSKAIMLYKLTRKLFIEKYSYKIKTNFNNVSFFMHNFDLILDRKFNPVLSGIVGYNFNYKVFEHNISSTFIEEYVMPPEYGFLLNRNLLNLTNTFHVEGKIRNSEILEGAFVCEYKDCNSSSIRYTYRGPRVGIKVAYKPAEKHAVSLESYLNSYEFYEDVFDSRFTLTRKDSGKEIYVKYTADLKKNLQLIIDYSLNENVSNDRDNFDPVYTLSYYSFSRSIYNISLRTTF